MGPGDAEPELRPSPPLASCAGVSWPKKGRPRAGPKVPAVSTRPRAPATTAMRWLMCLTDAAFRRTVCGSRLKEEVEPKPDLLGAAACVRASLRLASDAEAVAAAATCAGDLPRGDSASLRGDTSSREDRADSAGSGVLADSSPAETTEMAAVAGSCDAGCTTGIAAVAGAGVSGCTTGMAAVVGSPALDSLASDSMAAGGTIPCGTIPCETMPCGTMAGGTMGMAAVGGPGVVDFGAADDSGAITA